MTRLLNLPVENNHTCDGCGECARAQGLANRIPSGALPAGNAGARDFSSIARQLPELDASSCVGCMDCVTQCPDSAILAKVVSVSLVDREVGRLGDDAAMARQWIVRTTKFHDVPVRKGFEPGSFVLAVDPARCKGCGECVTACGAHSALRMVAKNESVVRAVSSGARLLATLPDTDDIYIQHKVLMDMMLKPAALLYQGGGASCMGCGEATAIRMTLAATGFVYGPQGVGVVAATGCNTVFGSTFPHNPYLVPWTSSLFENAPAVAMGIRARWNSQGMTRNRLWVIGGDGAMFDIGLQTLSRMLASGMDIKVLVLDTQAYSNTGGQAATSSFHAQEGKLSAYGSTLKGKTERRKELAQIAMMHADVFVAQTTCAHATHFYRSILAANEFPGPAVVIAYAPCQPEHGIADDASIHQAELAVTSRAFPLLVHDPRQGSALRERLSLQGNPASKKDWYVTPKGETIDFIAFARTEGRFARQFDKEGTPSPELQAAQADRLRNWHQLQELAGLRPS
ncbi:MAG: thiamine pyrophosphate-dependent enzyme [Acidiferrobacteraceae bacterium]